jgi:uroporphyrinogen III methyltransferase / synthase
MNDVAVYLVGAGPGDEGLLTLRAKEVLERCDVCIYDNLVDDRIVHRFARSGCEKIYVGKSGACHTMEQDGINRLMVDKARENKIVVRLKGGDPYIFGRGGEEALFLAENKIRFEVVSGISSAYAAPACAGIPVTNRGYSSSVAFITGHEDPTKLESDIEWDKIATGVQTLVFLMGVKNLPFIVDRLVRNGRKDSTPAAVIENGCGPDQRSVAGTLADIENRVKAADIRPPSIIIVGDVVSLRDKINWFENRPLFGKTILVTRSRDQASALSARLAELGASVVELPTIKIVPVEDAGPVHECIKNLARYDWIIFTSINGVTRFFGHMSELGLDSRGLSRNKICAIGSVTGERLRQFGIAPDLVPEKFISAEVADTLISAGEVEGKSFLLPRADIAPKILSETLLNAGAKIVDDIAVYRTVEEDHEGAPGLKKMLEHGSYDLVTFTSSSTVRNFTKLAGRFGTKGLNAVSCAVIGPVTAKTAAEAGYKVEIVAQQHTIEGLVEAICEYYEK